MSLQNGGGVTGVFSGGEVVKLFCNGDEFVPFKDINVKNTIAILRYQIMRWFLWAILFDGSELEPDLSVVKRCHEPFIE